MSSKKVTIVVVTSISILIVLFFIPINGFFGISSHNEEYPSLTILENNDDVVMSFKIAPERCDKTVSGLTESRFQITNMHEKDFEITLKISFTDNDRILFEKQAKVKILSGQTINQIHLSDEVYDNPICVVKIIDTLEI